jgi:S-methylmethionine-dependent homocysteine/selenocysteine methylase
MSAQQAEDYHREEIETFAGSAADMVCAITMNYAAEAVGVTRAARRAGMPVAISFTVETDGRLPTGQTLRAAIEEVDAATSAHPSYYMVNCAHPDHIAPALAEDGPWLERIHGLRANASRQSHAELNEATELDAGSPEELGRQYAALVRRLPRLNVMGGCCGTDHRHVGEACRAALTG